jgi:hypothetical protein
VGTNNGRNDCMGSLLTTPMAADQLEKGLLDVRARAQADSPNFGTFYPASTQHTWLYDESFYTATAGGHVKLLDWFSRILAGKPAQHVGP